MPERQEQSCSAIESSVVLSAQKGSCEAFTHLVRAHQNKVFRYMANRTDAHIASDLVQETFLIAFERIAELRNPQSFVPWLFRIARSTCVAHLRRRRRTLSLDRLLEQAGIGEEILSYGSPRIERLPTHILVQRVFRSMPPSDQEILYLNHVAGFTQPEIAEILDISVAAAKKRARRATIRFAKRYHQANERHEPRLVPVMARSTSS